MISLCQEMQENDQRATMLQLVDKFKAKYKELSMFSLLQYLYSLFFFLFSFFVCVKMNDLDTSTDAHGPSK